MSLFDRFVGNLFKRGEMTIILADGTVKRFGGPDPDLKPVTIRFADRGVPGLIARNHDALFPAESAPPAEVLALGVAAVLAAEDDVASADPWSLRDGWRLNQLYVRTLKLGGIDLAVTYAHDGFKVNGRVMSFTRAGDDYVLRLGDEEVRGTVVRDGETLQVFFNGTITALARFDPLAHAGDEDAHGGKLAAPMPGKIVALLAAKGATVKKGTPLLVMEAMKMEHTITAPSDGTVAEFLFAPGDQVAEGAELLKFG